MLSPTIQPVVDRITRTHTITLADRQALLAAMYDDSLNPVDRHCLRGLLQLACEGKLQYKA